MGSDQLSAAWLPLLAPVEAQPPPSSPGLSEAEGDHSLTSDPRITHSELLAQTRSLRAGDEMAWRWFHDRYYLPLLRYATQRLGYASAAPDVVQEAYLRIARHITPFQQELDFWRWLCCLVRCAAADYSRGAKRRNVLLEKFAHWRASQRDDLFTSPGPGSSDLADEALAKLPPEDAALLRARYYEGRSTVELAGALHVTPKAIENKLARLRERLREIISRLP